MESTVVLEQHFWNCILWDALQKGFHWASLINENVTLLGNDKVNVTIKDFDQSSVEKENHLNLFNPALSKLI